MPKSKSSEEKSAPKSKTKEAAAKKPSDKEAVQAEKTKVAPAPLSEKPAKASKKLVAETIVQPAAKSKSRNNHPAPSVTEYLLSGSKKSESAIAAKLSPFLRKQKERLLMLRDAMLDSMKGVAQDNLRSRAEGSEASAFGMHQADAGSDAYDRDFALNLLSQEQDALYEIDEALKRIDLGTYGVCEMSSKPIGHERLEAIPFTRYTVECQSQLEKQSKAQRVRQAVTSLFGLTEDEEPDKEEEEFTSESKE